jgi:hypothetical protein
MIEALLQININCSSAFLLRILLNDQILESAAYCHSFQIRF